MKVFSLLLLVCALTTTWVNAQLPDWLKNCGDPAKDLLTIDTITLNPEVPVIGQNVHIDFKGSLKKTVDKGASVSIAVKLGAITVIDKKYDFCDEVTKFGGACPLNAGPIQISKDVTVPSGIPASEYTFDVKVNSADNEEVICLHGTTTLSGAN